MSGAQAGLEYCFMTIQDGRKTPRKATNGKSYLNPRTPKASLR